VRKLSKKEEMGSGITGQGSVEPRRESGSGNIKSYRDLDAWKKAMDLVVECYQNTKKFPKSEIFGLSSQLERAAVSVAANIAEGRSRGHTKEFLQHLSIAYGSLAELETHLQIAERLHYITTDELSELLNKTTLIGKLINGLRKSLESRL
jgi:four helix bundle protein